MAAKVNLNTANEQELKQINGINDKHAQQIVELRERKGKLQSFDDLRELVGFSDNMVKDVQDQASL